MRQLAILLVVLIALGVGIYYGVQYLEMRDPYVQLVMAEKGNFRQGAAIFQINCAGCHGIQGDGLVGPSLHGVSARKSSLSLIRQVISGKTPPMPQFQPNPQEMADLLSYLSTL
jgi:mono/diheme cytochrome c family protein